MNTTAADLLVALGEDKITVKQGGIITYTITVKNFGPNRALNTIVNDTLSSSTTFVSANANKGFLKAPPVGQTSTVTWYLGELLPTGQDAAQIEVTVIIRGKTTITNTATVQSNTPDPNLVKQYRVGYGNRRPGLCGSWEIELRRVQDRLASGGRSFLAS